MMGDSEQKQEVENLRCPYCGENDFYYKIRMSATVAFYFDDDNEPRVYDRDIGDTQSYENIYCCACDKVAFKRSELETQGIDVPI